VSGPADAPALGGWREVADEDAFAAALARAAGERLLALRRAPPPGDIGLAGDRAAHRLLVEAIRGRYPDDAILSEEAADDRRRLTSERVWIIDPLDGTREFREGRADWAVHVALWRCRRRALVLSSDAARPLAPPPGDLRVRRFLVSRTRPPAVAAAVARTLGAELVPMGSAGAKAAAVVMGEAEAYLHAGGQHEWDSAAPAGVAAAAGLHVSRLDGRPLRYNQPIPWLPDLLICRPELAEPILRAVAAATEASERPRERTRPYARPELSRTRVNVSRRNR
jgi:3'(2'), 5'-bisphosphate nucleotidase